MERKVTDSIRLMVLEKEEVYRYLYLSLPFGEEIILTEIFPSFDIDEITHGIKECRPDVLLISSDRLNEQLIAMMSQVREKYPNLGVALLLFSCDTKDSDNIRELASTGNGGLAVFFRQSLLQVEQITGIIEAAKRGHYIFDPSLANRMFSKDVRSPFLDQLTHREMEILSLVAKGYSNLAIAETLYIDIKTVEHHLNNLYNKIKIDNDFDRKHQRVTAARLYLTEVGV